MTKLVLPKPSDQYDPRQESQRNLLIEQAIARAGAGSAAAATSWGDIIGNIADQTDLQAALAEAKAQGWNVVTAGRTLVAGDKLLAVITTTQNFPLPASPAAGDRFIVANARGSTGGALARVQTGLGKQIIGTPSAGDDVTVAPGETIYLVARSSTLLEIV
jgi:hypothetical protein